MLARTAANGRPFQKTETRQRRVLDRQTSVQYRSREQLVVLVRHARQCQVSFQVRAQFNLAEIRDHWSVD